MEKSRGKKGKKGIWNLTLGLRDAIFAGVGIVGLMMMSFALGALAGRGDIYRVAYSWGLMDPDSARVAQWSPAGTPPLTAAQASPAPQATEAAPPAAAAPHPAGQSHHAAVAAKSGHQAPVTGSIAAVPSPSAASKKKGKTATANRDPKSKEEEMRQVRRDVVRKLKFQNSFDTPPKTAHKPKDKAPVKAAAKPAAPVRVGQFKDSKTAQAKVAELQKKGVKASVKQTKDKKGTTLYEVYKPGAVSPPVAEKKLAQKPAKSTVAPKKPRVE